MDDDDRPGAADADRPRRHHVPAGPAQRGAGARCGHRRPDLGVPQAVRALAGRLVPRPHPVDRHLRRQDLPEHERRPHRRPRRPHRRRGLGPRGGRQRARLPLHERADRREREDRRRHDGLRALQGRHLLHLRPRPANRGGALAHVDDRPAGGTRRRHLGRPARNLPGRRRRLDSGKLRPGDEPDLLVDVPGQAVGPAVARHGRRRPLHQQCPRPRPRHRRHRLVLPVRAGRDARPRRRVRERAHRPPGPAVAVQDGQAGHPVGARPRRPGRSSPPTTSATRRSSTSTRRPARPPTGPR